MTLWFCSALLVSIVLIFVLALDELRERKQEDKQASNGLQELVGVVLWNWTN
jgi:hypothetical protein